MGQQYSLHQRELQAHFHMRLMMAKWELIFQFQCSGFLLYHRIQGIICRRPKLLWDAAVHFFTQIKTVTSQWTNSDLQGVSMVFPTSQKVWGMRSWAVQFYNVWPALLAAKRSWVVITKTASQNAGAKTNAQVRWWRMKASSGSIGEVQDNTG